MSKDLVVYHNDMNKVSFAGFKEKELDLFFGICFKLKESEKKEIELSFSELKNLIGENNNPKRLKQHIDSLKKKLASLTQEIEISPNVFEMFVLFTNFTTDYNKSILTITVNNKFEYILNNLIGNYTKFDLIEFVGLTSIYSKQVFKLLKQWDSVKCREFSIEEFRSLLGVPVKYRISEIDKKVLIHIMKELPKYFYNLKLEKIKTGRTVTSLKFTWSNSPSKKSYQEEDLVEEVSISPGVNEAIEKACKNRFIKPHLTDINIKKLVDKYSEEMLIHGLKFAYREIKKEFKSLSYLYKTIQTSLDKKDIKIKVKADDYVQTKLDDVPSASKEEKKSLDQNPMKQERVIKEVTQEQFNILYQGYLIQNDVEDNPFIKQAYGINYKIIEKPQGTISQEDKKEVLKTAPTRSKKIYTIEDIEEHQLLSKTGKKLVGGALQTRVRKLLNELNK